MKKVYVKTKTPSAKTILKRPYIAATIIVASVCAIILSLSVKTPDTNVEEKENVLSLIEDKPKENPAPEPKELPLPSENEVLPPKELPEISVPNQESIQSADEDSVSVGIFSGGKKLSLLKPAEGEIMKPFSDTKPIKSETLGDWRIHTGVDIRAEKGTDVKAVSDGKVISAKKDTLTGYTIVIDHGNGVISTTYNLESADMVSEGQDVKKGDVIGKVGESATIEMSDAHHIHFEIIENGKFLNPEDYFE